MLRRFLLATALATACIALGVDGASAGKPKVGNTAMGALAGAVVFGPIGLVAGGVVGYAAGEDIAHGMGLKRRHRHHHRRPARAVQRD